MLFDTTPYDRAFYEERIQSFLPDSVIDIHTHVWRQDQPTEQPRHTQAWPSRVASENTIDALLETYALLLPRKQVTPLIFPYIPPADQADQYNDYVQHCATTHACPSLIYALPSWSAEVLEERILAGHFLGVKSYYSHAPVHLQPDQIRIFDYFPHHHLEVLNQHGWIMMCHLPRSGRLRDPMNLADMMEIDRRYPNIKLIIAHVGRAYCDSDVGDAFEQLSDSSNIRFDISANSNAWVFEQAIHAVGAQRILFGTDLPIARMRCHRICKEGTYVNLVPPGVYGDISKDPHMREVSHEQAEKVTFLMYEEIDAFRKACEQCGLSKEAVEDVFYNNARTLLSSIDNWHGRPVRQRMRLSGRPTQPPCSHVDA